MPTYNKAAVGQAAQQYGFVRDTFEKVLRLTRILQYCNEQECLRDHLLLKGGTAINLTVFDLPRLSVDIDMDYTPNDSREDMLVVREQITAILRQYMDTEGYQLSPASRYHHSLDAFHYQYQNTGGNRDMIKIEINYSLRAHVFEPIYRKILPAAFDTGVPVRTVAPMEIFAAKGNALMSRAASRDLYDWGNMIEQQMFADNRDLFRKCMIYYATISADKDHINRNFETGALDLLTFNKIRHDLFPVIRQKDHFDLEARKQQARDYISDLMQLTDDEAAYMDLFLAKQYRPELLFDDPAIVERIWNHPMALWKCR